ncbi:MAG: hypothetical protein ACJATI_000017 [Halioglobus sp.]|jgi:hypothetical protein
MIHKLQFTLSAFIITTSLFAQQINNIKDLRPVSGSGVRNVSCNFSNDFYFAGNESQSAFLEVFSTNENLEMSKRIGAPNVRGVEGLYSTDNYLYIYTREQGNIMDLYRSEAGNNDDELIVSLENSIVQSFVFNSGLVFITEDNQENKNVFYISDDSDEVISVLENVNLGQYDFDVTNHGEYIILSPLDDRDYEEGITFFNTIIKQVQNDLLISQCNDVRYAYGFGEHIVYSCMGDYYVTNVATGDVALLDIDGRDALRQLISNNLFFDTKNHILIEPQEGDDIFYSISKDDLGVEILCDKTRSKVNLYDQNGLIYFNEKDESGVRHLFQNDGTLASKKEIVYEEENFFIRKGAVLNGIPHFIVKQGSSFSDEYIVSIDPSDELKAIAQINTSVNDPVLEVLGDHIVFINEANNLGVELYSLSYVGSSVEDNNIQDLSVYPNPSSGILNLGIDESEIVTIDVLNTTGQRAEFTLDGNVLSITQAGFHTVQIKTRSAKYGASVVITE